MSNIPADLPVNLANDLITGVTETSGVLQVCDGKPQTGYLQEGYLKMTGELKAASLDANQARKGSDLVNAIVKVPVHTFSVVYRFPEELASIDAEINGGLLAKALEKGKGAIAKAVDTVFVAGKDGFGDAVPDQVYAAQTTHNVVLDEGNWDDSLDALVRLLLAAGVTNAGQTVALLDMLAAYDISLERTAQGVKKNDVNIQGRFPLKTAQAIANGHVKVAGTAYEGFLFDKDIAKVAIGTNIRYSRETTGNPDNLFDEDGKSVDLKGHRQQAIVLDVPYSVGILDLSRVVALKNA